MPPTKVYCYMTAHLIPPGLKEVPDVSPPEFQYTGTGYIQYRLR
jgi:hypothetical protein